MSGFQPADISDLSARMKAGALSPVEVTKAYLERIREVDASLHAFVEVVSDEALADAERCEREIRAGDWRGPLHGIPYAVKDIIDVAGRRTAAGSRILMQNIAAASAPVVDTLEAQGAILLGKTATYEFAHGGPSFDLPWPPPRNPWNVAHATGGSSSGAGAAVAAGLVPLALGTDTGGSIRMPAWFCGVVGLKPTYGRLSTEGVIPFSESCDHVGTITWSVRDAALALGALDRPSRRPASSLSVPPFEAAPPGCGIKGMRIGFVRHFSERDCPVDPELSAAVDAALLLLGSLGAKVEEITLEPLRDYYDTRVIISECEIFALHLRQFQLDHRQYGRQFLSRTLAGCLIDSATYVEAQRDRARMTQVIDARLEDYDALITVGAGAAPELKDTAGAGGNVWAYPNAAAMFGALPSLTGLPALALCCGFSRKGLPLGMQIIGRRWDETRLLTLGHAYEVAAGWRTVRPVPVAPQKTPVAAARDPAGDVAPDHGRRSAEKALERFGIALSEEEVSFVADAVPHIRQMVERLWARGRGRQPFPVFADAR